MNRVDKIIKYGLFLILLLPLAFTPFTFFPWHYGKTVIFQILVEVAAVLWIWGKLSSPRRRGSSQSNVIPPNMLDSPIKSGNDSFWAVFRDMFNHLNFLDWSILVFLLILTLTSLTGANPSNSFWGNQARANGVFTWLHFGVFYFMLKWFFNSTIVIPAKAGIQDESKLLDSLPTCLVGRQAGEAGRFRGNDKERPSWSFLRILTVAVMVAVLASLTSLFPNLLPVSWQSEAGGGIIGNRAFLASYLVLAIGISLYLFVNYLESRNVVLSSRPSPDAKIGASGGISLSRIKGIPRLRFASLGMTKMIFVWRWLFLAAPVLFLYTIFDAGNRGALLGAIVGIFIGLPISFFVFSNKKYKIIVSSCFIALFSLLIALFFLRSNQTFLSTFPKISSLTDFSFSSGTAATRLMAWQSAWRGIKEKPLLGWGWGNYGVVFDKYYNPQFLKHGFTETVWDKPHNWLLEIGVTAGILGMVSYLAILFFAGFYLFMSSPRKRPASPACLPTRQVGRESRIFQKDDDWISDQVGNDNRKARSCVSISGRIIFSAALPAYFIAGLFLFETTNSLILWFAILAFVSAFSAFDCHPRESGDPVGNKRIGLLDSHFRRVDKVRQLFVLFIILFISYLLFLNFRSLKSSYYMRQAELSNALIEWTGFANRVLAIKVPFLSENAVFLAEQLTKFDKAGVIVKEKKVEDAALKIAGILEGDSSKYPNNLSFPVWAGQVYMVLGEKFDKKYYQQAEKNLLKAENISPNKQEVSFLLGRFYLLTRDFNKAIDFQKKAVVAAPEINISHWFLGLTYVAQGERAKGLEEIENAMELGYNLTADQKLYVLDLYALEKNYSKLIEEYKKSIEGNPGNLNWYIKLAVVYAESGDKKSALETVRYAVGLFPPLKAEADKFIKQYKLE